MSFTPLIGVVAYHLGDDRVSRWPKGGYGVPGPYIEALHRAGARSAIISPGQPGDAEDVLEPFDGLVLVGGGDIDPARYGGRLDSGHTYGVEPDRDGFEIGLVLAADRTHLPTLCICRGLQVMNVAFGGTLHQHLPDMADLIAHGVPLEDTATTHLVTPEPGTVLSASTKSGDLACSSHHHQGIDRLGDGLEVAGRSPDGLVEALQRVGVDGDRPFDTTWMLGVQWHPEDTAASDPVQESLFDAVTLIARARGSRARAGETEGRGRDYRLADPDPEWPLRFDEEAARILEALPTGLVTRIDHVGSTSVPGLAAKPVIDIQLSLDSMVPRDAYVAPLQGLGYVWSLDPWDDIHEFFSREDDLGRASQIHACLAGSGWERRHLAFRDALRDRPEITAAYERLKRDLVAEHPRDIMSYVAGKTAFIRRVEAETLGQDRP